MAERQGLMADRSLGPFPPPAPDHRGRRGAIGALLLVSVVAMLAIAALVINFGWVYCHHHKLQSACEAAALAGAAELIDDSHLYASAPGDRGDDDESPRTLRIRRAKQQAARFAAANGVALDLGEDEQEEELGAVTTLATLDARAEKRSRARAAAVATGEVVVWEGSPVAPRPEAPLDEVARPPAAEWKPAARQGMIVRAGREKSRGNPLAMWLGGITGITRGDVVAEAGAVLDQRVFGFRPAGHVEVPLVPVAISASSDSTERFWGAFRLASAHEPADGGSAPVRVPGEPLGDSFTVDFRTTEVSGGPDGIPEVVLKIRATDPSKSQEGGKENAWVVSLTGPQWRPLVFDLQVRDGLRPQDLDSLGGQIALGPGATLVLPTPEVHKSQLGQIREALAAIQGQKRVWMLGDSPGDGSVQVVAFVAACVVDCRWESDSCLAVIVEPCVLETCTALVGGGNGLNPFVGKVMLER